MEHGLRRAGAEASRPGWPQGGLREETVKRFPDHATPLRVAVARFPWPAFPFPNLDHPWSMVAYVFLRFPPEKACPARRQ
jgi:hypothetical protein